MPERGLAPAAARRSPGCGPCGKASRRVFGHAAPRPGFQGLHERGLNDVLDEVEPAHAERPDQHGDKPAELMAEKVLPQCAGFAHA